MFQKPNTVIACLHSEFFSYILRLNKYICEHTTNLSILATENKKIYVKNKWTGLYRPLICFDYDENKSKQFCFFMTGDKDYHKFGDVRFYFFNSNDKLRLDNPVWIPTKYLKKINFVDIKEKQLDQIISLKIYEIEQQYTQILKNKDEIWEQYKNIKYAKSNRHSILYAHEEMIIRDMLSEKFCNMELEKIKNKSSKLSNH